MSALSRLRRIWDSLRSTLWFGPTLIILGSIVLAVAMIEFDATVERRALTETWPRVFGAGAEGSRGLLAAIAGSMITVAGVTFSITVVALSLASSQYTSRVLRNFMRDRANQTVLGVFVGVFAYCLVVLRTIRSGDDREEAFVPALAVLMGMILAFVAIGYLVFFIHHIATSIQATSILHAIRLETLAAIDRLFPEDVGEAANPSTQEPLLKNDERWVALPSCASGYIQSIEIDLVFEAAREFDTVIRMERGIGEFIVEGSPLASAVAQGETSTLTRAVQRAFVIGKERTVQQDAAYGIRQIVDIALKALSPGINDTTTAINAVDQLGVILSRLASRSLAVRARSPEKGRHARVLTRGPTFTSLFHEAVDDIRRNSTSNVAVQIRLLEMLAVVASRTSDTDRRQVIREQADLIVSDCMREAPHEHDRRLVVLARSSIL